MKHPVVGIILLAMFFADEGCSSKKEQIGAEPSNSNPDSKITPKADCEHPLHGSTMVKVTAPNGVSYCMDRTEVSQGQYAEFLASAKEDKSFQDKRCGSDNTSYSPWVSADHCNKFEWAEDGIRPMTCVDWCDATAYCNWAGKRLCGKIGGGTIDTVRVDFPDGTYDYDLSQGKEATVSAWYNACSQGGKTLFSYGDEVDSSLCSSKGESMESCKGSISPYDQILDLSGSVDEWEDMCDPSRACLVRGGLESANAIPGRCDDLAGLTGGSYDRVGFRCCAD